MRGFDWLRPIRTRRAESRRTITSQRTTLRRRAALRRRALFAESLEPRILLSGTPWEARPETPRLAAPAFSNHDHASLDLPGLQLVDQQANRFESQVIYLDFDGAMNVTYNGPVHLEGIDVPAFQAPGALAGQEPAIMAAVVQMLSETFAGSGVTFTTALPEPHTDYSTIYVGGDDSAFAAYGSFQGLAEKVDVRNLHKSDNAFVFTSEIAAETSSFGIFAAHLAKTITHETGHLLGYAHRKIDADVALGLSSVADGSVVLSGVPDWTAQGPRQIINSGSVTIPNNKAIGAIETIVVNPNDSNTLFAGAVAGGVWRTNTSHNADPDWVPLMDQQESLYVGAMALAPNDSNTLYVGTGSYSNTFRNQLSQTAVGIYRTNNANAAHPDDVTWTNLGRETFFGLPIRRLVVSRSNPMILFAAAADENGGGGLFNSCDGGVTWSQITCVPGAPPNPLPIGRATDVLSDPQNNNRFYAALPGNGVYRSDDSGVTWIQVDQLHTPIPPATILASTNIELTAHAVAATTVVYVGVVGATRGVFRSPTGDDWTEIGPATFPILNNTNQEFNNFAIVADPVESNIVYISGNIYPYIYRGQFDLSAVHNPANDTWTPIAGSDPLTNTPYTMTGSRPHADSRFLVFRDNNTLLEADDGGIYQLSNPRNAVNTIDWVSRNGNLQITEFHSVAYDTNSNLIFGGAQDNGSSVQTAIGGGIVPPLWTEFLGGDGSTQAYDTVNDVRYSLSNNFGFFERDGTQLQLRANAADANFSGLDSIAVGLNSTDFIFAQGSSFNSGIPVEVNSVTQSRIMFGRFGLYESLNKGDIITSLTAQLVGKPADDRITAIVYGGRRIDGGGNLLNLPEVAVIATASGRLYFRGEGVGAMFISIPLGAPGGLPMIVGVDLNIRDVVVDPQDWRRVYLILGSPTAKTDSVWMTNDITALVANPFKNINGNLTEPPGTRTRAMTTALRSIALFDNTPQIAGDSIVLAGGLGGVFRRLGGDTWTEYGARLPNTLVQDLHYIPVDPDNNAVNGIGLLLAGTFGRGAWTIPNVSATVGMVGVLEITGTADADTIEIVRNVFNPSLLDVSVTTSGVTSKQTVQLSPLQRIEVNGGDGDDTLRINSLNGVISVVGGIHYDGGNDSDHLILFGGAGGTKTFSSVGPNAGSGSAWILGSDGFEIVDFTETEDLQNSIADQLLTLELNPNNAPLTNIPVLTVDAVEHQFLGLLGQFEVEFHTEKATNASGTAWGDLIDWGPSSPLKTIGPFLDGLYRIRTSVKNSLGLMTFSDYRYFRILSNVPQAHFVALGMKEAIEELGSDLTRVLASVIGSPSGSDVDAENVGEGFVASAIESASVLDTAGQFPFAVQELSDVVDLPGLFEQLANRLSDDPAITGTVAPTTTNASDERFVVSGNNLAPTEILVSVTAGATLEQVLDAVNLGFENAGVASLLQATKTTDGRLVLSTREPGTLQSLALTTLRLPAANPAPAFGQLATAMVAPSDQLQLKISRVAASNDPQEPDVVTPYSIQLGKTPPGPNDDPFSFTQDNTSAADLADDLNTAFVQQGLTDVIAVVESTPQAHLVLISTSPDVTLIELVQGGSPLGFGTSVVQSTSPASLLGFVPTRSLAALKFDSVASFLPVLEDALRAVSDPPLPPDFALEPVYDQATNTLLFNFAVNKSYSRPTELDFFNQGIDLGDFGTLEVAALADANLTALTKLDFELGLYLGDLGGDFVLVPAMPVAELNAGQGVQFNVGIRADGQTPTLGMPGQDVTFSLNFSRDDGETATTWTLPLSAASRPVSSDNVDLESLADDLNALFPRDGLDQLDLVEASVYRKKNLSGQVVDERLVLTVLDPTVRSLRIDGGEPLGFSAAQHGNFNDLEIIVSTGGIANSYIVDLDRNANGHITETVADVIAIIEAATSNRVKVEISPDAKGLMVTAWDAVNGQPDTLSSVSIMPAKAALAEADELDSQNMTVTVVTSGVMSLAGTGLGIWGDSELDKTDSTVDYVLEGTPLHGQTERDRLYIQERLGGDPQKNLSIRLGLEVNDIDVSASLGQLSFEIQGDDDAKNRAGLPESASDIDLGITIATNFQDPGIGDEDDGNIYLSEIVASPNQVLVLNPLNPTETTITFDGAAFLALGVNHDNDKDQFLKNITGDANPVIQLQVIRSLNTSTGEPEFKFDVNADAQALFTDLKDLDIDDILQVVKGVIGELQDAEDMQFMTEKLPLVNKSLNEIVDFTDGVADAVEQVLSAIDEVALQHAIEAAETAVTNISLPLDDRRRMFRAVDVLNRLKPPYSDAQLVDDFGNATDWRERLPGRLLSAVRNLAKAIQVEAVNAGSPAGTDALLAARDALIALVPQLNTVGERVAKAIEDALRAALPAGTLVVVDIGAIPDISSDVGNQRAVTVGIKLRNDKWYEQTFDIALPPDLAEIGPLSVSLTGAPTLYVGGEIDVGVAARLDSLFAGSNSGEPNSDEFLVIAGHPARQPLHGLVQASALPANFATDAAPTIPASITTLLNLAPNAVISIEKARRADDGTLLEADRWLIKDKVGAVDETHYVLERSGGQFEVRQRPINEVHLHRTGISLNVGFDGQAAGSIELDGLGSLIDAQADLALLRSEYREFTGAAITNGTVSFTTQTATEPLHGVDSRFLIVAVTYLDPTNSNRPTTEVLRGGAGGQFTASRPSSSSYIVDVNTWLTAKNLASSQIDKITIAYQSPSYPGLGTGADRAANSANRAAGVLAIQPLATLTNDIGGVRLQDLFDSSKTRFDVDLQGCEVSGVPTCGSLVVGTLDATVLGTTVDDAVIVAASLDHLGSPQFYVDTAALGGLFQNIDFDLKALFRAARLLLDKLDQGIKEKTVTKLPLVGNLDKADTFIVTLRDEFLTPLESFVMTNDGTFDEMESLIETEIVQRLGPNSQLKPFSSAVMGTGILGDRNSDNAVDANDVVVTITEDTFEIQFLIDSYDESVIGFNTGLDELPLTAEGGVKLRLGYTYDVGWGYNKVEGFYLITNPDPALGDPVDPEIALTVEAGLVVNRTDSAAPVPTTMEATLGDVKLSVTDLLKDDNGVLVTGTSLQAGFDLDIVSLPNETHRRLTDIANTRFEDVFAPSVSGVSGELHVRLEAGVGTDLPSVQAEVKATFLVSASNTPGEFVLTPEITELRFQNVGIRLGCFCNKQMGQVIDFVDRFLGPLKPVVELLKSEVPGLSQVAQAANKPAVTFLDLFLTQVEDPQMARNAKRFVETVDVLITLVDTLKNLQDDQLVILIRDVDLTPAPQINFTSVAAQTQGRTDLLASLSDVEAGLKGEAATELNKVQGPLGRLLEKINSIGVHLDLVETPTNIIKLLLSDRFDIISWDLPRFEFPFTFEQSFRPFPPIVPLVVRIGFDFSIFAQLSVGYDSRGLQTGKFLDGFHFRDLERATGDDIAEFGLLLAVRLAALLDAGVASAGIEGEVRGTLDANWHDPDRDGKMYLDEIRQIVRTDGLQCVFDIHGELRALVRLVYEVLGKEGELEFINVLLFEFNNKCPTYELGHVVEGTQPRAMLASGPNAPHVPGTLVLHAGAFASQRYPGKSSDVDEPFEVEQVAPGVFDVRALGLINRYSGVEEIYFDGGVGQDRLTLINVTVPVTALGGIDDDILVGTRNDDYLDGGAGQDLIIGRGGNDRLFGGDGRDSLWGDFADSPTDPDLAVPGNLWGPADPDVNGLGVNDTIEGGEGHDVITGGSGRDTILGQGGQDILYGNHGDDLLDGGSGRDFVLADLGEDTIRGGSGHDFISGGLGTDHLFGDGGNDLIVGGFATNFPSGQAEQNQLVADGFKDLFTAALGLPLTDQEFWTLLQGKQTFVDSNSQVVDSADDLYGGAGNDLLIGSAGADRQFGGYGNDTLIGYHLTDPSSTDLEHMEGGPNDDFICGTDGQDRIVGGTTDENNTGAVINGLAELLTQVPETAYGGWKVTSCDTTPTPVNIVPAQLHGRLFNDANNDTLRGADEEPLSGWTVQLLDTAGQAVVTTQSDQDGQYDFVQIDPTDYTVLVVIRPGWHQTTAAPGTLTVAPGQSLADVDFGMFLVPTLVTGVKFHDRDADGVRDVGEEGISGWGMKLYDAEGQEIASTMTHDVDLNGDGVIDPEHETGFYEFTGLPPAAYSVGETPRPDWVQTAPVVNAPGQAFVPIADDGYSTTPSDLQVEQQTSPIPNNQDVIIHVELAHPNPAQLRLSLVSAVGTRLALPGIVNQVLDASLPNFHGEEPNGTWTLVIEDTVAGDAGRLVSWTLTFGLGGTPVPGGPPVPLQRCKPQPRQDVQVPLPDNNGSVPPLTVDFGAYRLGSATGWKFDDLNGNGLWDRESSLEVEPGRAGVEIFVDLNNNGRRDREEPRTLTQSDDLSTPELDETGRYWLTALPPGQFVIREVAPPLYRQTFPTNSLGGGLPPGYVVSVTAGQILADLDFGNQPVGEIHGQKFNDLNGNGLREPREPGIAGVRIYLDANNDSTWDQNETFTFTMSDDPTTKQVNETGMYWLRGLPAGQHVVREVLPAGSEQTSAGSIVV